MRLGTLHLYLAISALLSVQIGGAGAANYHYQGTLSCPDCHISHASRSHNDTGGTPSPSEPPTKNLLTYPTVTDLCLHCHDGQAGIPDVAGDDVNNPSERYDGTDRAGGRFATGSEDNWRGHNLPGQGSRGPGECTACHNPHGNTNYRNLRALDGSQEEPIAYVNPSAAGLDNYRRSNVAYAKNFADRLCGACHDLGLPENTVSNGGRSHFIRHPSSSAQSTVRMGSSGAHADLQHWLSGMGSGFESEQDRIARVPFAVSSATDFVAASAVSAENEVFCLSCHKAHGSVHAFGMVWPYGTGAGALNVSGCNQCHNVSGA